MSTSFQPRTVIFDTDPGIDDAMALWMLARHPALDLRAITTVHGNAPVATTTRNALALVDFFGLDVPVAMGADDALLPRLQRFFPTQVHHEDGLGGGAPLLPPTSRRPDPRPAWQLICDEINAAPGEITLVAVAPLTNLALALRHDPGIAAKVREVVLMGGAFGLYGHGGNVTPVAEANIINDPEAADLVFTAPWPVVAVGLDVTQQVVMPESLLQSLSGRAGAVGDFFWEITRHYQRYYDGRDAIGGLYAHDASAVVYCVAPEAFERRSGPVRVALDGIARGQTIQDHLGLFDESPESPWRGCPAQQVCVGVDAQRVRDEFTRLFPPAGQASTS
ncbi:nucleoside hydrolase [Pelomonas sp. APW6]|uniref:Nucleoside hydrolase n=1 Tax=Roseateles subflavus TaxID=3053353 RepID=A0ABT7LKA7_9BURK|nr:nucleoside hydrolase [Pelomonas sp. APW6]MDL5033239.1 nucleoside hydrolase [Pelomonas sp. APW6]